MTDKVAATRQAKRRKTQKLLDDVRHSISIIHKYCIGCKVIVSEGCRSYTQLVETHNGICSKCNKPRYFKGIEQSNKNTSIIQNIKNFLKVKYNALVY